MGIKFGFAWPFRNPAYARVPWADLYRSHLDLIVESEALGYDYAWLTEHHFLDDGYSPSLLPLAAAIAMRTTRIRIGTFLVLLPLHNPIRIAEDTATVDLLSNGRFELGVGLGYRVKEFADQGIAHTERGARLTEGIALIQRLLRGECVTYEGRYNSLREIEIRPPALQRPHPPLWLGAIAPAAIERAARMGFHFQAVGPSAMDQAYDAALVRHGRNPADYHIAQLRAMFIAPSRAQAWELAAAPLHYMTRCYVEWFGEAGDKPGDSEALAGLPSVEEMIARQSFEFFGVPVIVGTPEDARGMLADYFAQGRMTHLVMMTAMPGLAPQHVRDCMQLFARDVLPAFRGRD